MNGSTPDTPNISNKSIDYPHNLSPRYHHCVAVNGNIYVYALTLSTPNHVSESIVSVHVSREDVNEEQMTTVYYDIGQHYDSPGLRSSQPEIFQCEYSIYLSFWARDHAHIKSEAYACDDRTIASVPR